MSATVQQITALTKGYGGKVHGNDSVGRWDVEFPDLVSAMSLIQILQGDRETTDLGFWFEVLTYRLRDGDSITDLDAPVVITFW